MELKQLSYFLAVAEHRSFSRAAEALFISQPALSYQIAELERDLSAPLFVRDKRKIYLTPEGTALIGPATELIERARELTGVTKRAAGGYEHGLLRVGFDMTEDHFEFTGILDTLARFGMAHPGIEFENFHGPFPECADRVIYGDLDVAFLITRYNEHLPSDLTGKDIYHSKLLMVLREDLSVDTCEDALARYDLILVDEKPRGNSRILKALETLGLHPCICRVDSIPTAFLYMKMGRGCMMMSEIYFQHHPYEGIRAIPIPSDAAALAHTMVWNKSNHAPLLSKLINEFL